MRATGLRSFRFPKAELGTAHNYRISVLGDEATLWWWIMLTTRVVDRRWAFRQALDVHSRRFVALALEHASARRQGREPDPEVDGATPGRWGRYVTRLGRSLTLGFVVAVFLAGLIVCGLLLLAAMGLIDVQVATR